MATSPRLVALVLVAASALGVGAPALAEVESGVIRLGDRNPADRRSEALDASSPERRGFDYASFESRFEASWFRRKALLAEGRDDDAHRQAELIRLFCAEEGVSRLETAAGALLAEARRFYQEGSYEKALASLDLAETFDPGRAQIHLARAAVLRASGDGYLEAARDLARGVRAAFAESWRDWTLVNHVAIVVVVALLGVVALFAVLMVLEYHVPFRHEIEEAVARLGAERWATAAGWALLLLPLLAWYLAGWILLYWLVVTFRFMRRGERLATVALLAATAAAVPAFRVSVALYGMTTDPAVRTTLESAGGAYSPDRVVKLKALVDTHPDDPVYRFLLAGLYKEGRYFEEAYKEYRRVLEIDPASYQAHINIGNIFHRLGQYGEAIAEYRQALEIRPDAALAYYNMYLSQSESFGFREAEESLRLAQQLDRGLTGNLLSRASAGDSRTSVQDATVDIGSVWRAALEGRPLRETLEEEDRAAGPAIPLPGQLMNPLSVVAVLALMACGAMLVVFRERPARRCIRCGRAHCQYCRSGRQGQEYCSQCLHLFVIGDGLAPETKTRKLYEVERYEKGLRRGRRVLSLLLPGSAHLLGGVAGRGCLLVFLWLTALIAWKPEVLLPVERLTGIELHLDMLRPGSVPDAFTFEPSSLVALMAAVAVWTAGNAWLRHRREV